MFLYRLQRVCRAQSVHRCPPVFQHGLVSVSVNSNYSFYTQQTRIEICPVYIYLLLRFLTLIVSFKAILLSVSVDSSLLKKIPLRHNYTKQWLSYIFLEKLEV